jgi:ElaB/YqjD/DUF883 family membrane-anchored ribosome-binding protein
MAQLSGVLRVRMYGSAKSGTSGETSRSFMRRRNGDGRRRTPMTQQKANYPLNYGQDTAKDRLQGMAEATADKVKDAAANAQEMAGKVADQAREYGEQAQQAAKQIRPFMEKSLKEQPIATLAGVAIFGFLLGALWKK